MPRLPSTRTFNFPGVDADAPPVELTSLETPVPIVDLDVLAANIERMATYTTLHGLALRPHVKTHKSPRIAADQVRQGAIGLTCATLRELEVMSDVTGDLLLAYPPIGAPRLARLMQVSSQVNLTIALDSMAALGQLAAAARVSRREVSVLVEIDLGMHRVGVQRPEEAVRLARTIGEHSPLQFAGVMFYPGHIREHVDQQDTGLASLRRDLAVYLDALRQAGVPARIVSGGSTPLAWRMHEVPGITEVRPGTYVYNDRTTAAIGACEPDDCALTVLATVISRSVPDQAVIDAGAKALGREPLRATEGTGFGSVRDYPEVVVERMSEEHGILDLRGSSWQPEVGEQIRIVPNHVCIVVHLNDEIYGVRDEVVETSWAIEARGR